MNPGETNTSPWQTFSWYIVACQEPPGSDLRYVTSLNELLLDFQPNLLGFVRKNASGLLRYEEPEDIVQGVYLQASHSSENFQYRDQPSFESWVLTVARRYIVDRHHYWRAKKRDAGYLLRVTNSDLSEFDTRGIQVANDETSPSSFAARKEHFLIAVRALRMLPERDQQLVRCYAQGHSIAETATELELSEEAASRARSRALERFRKGFERLAGGPQA